MSKNTYKTSKKDKKSKKIQISILADRRFQIAVGLAFLISSLFLLISFISYIDTGKADQSVVDAFRNSTIKDTGQEVQNMFGLFGALTGHYFIFQWFGIMSLLIPPFLFNIGYRILYERQLFPITKSLVFISFYLIWTSLLLGYIVLTSQTVTEWAFVSGGIGYELAIILDSLMGWGTVLFVIFMFLIFNMYFFNITSLPGVVRLFNWFSEFSMADLKNRFFRKTEDHTDISSVIEQVKKEVEKEDL
ncbi:MAG: DNA translocase FtsK 4TM domain-containing protein, partial [Proteobacteria bacterium]|nr:DNA translocase FtsK 4TM domain-containing protein [Pseudomonadota bacterium]